ncbi:MAG: FtsW/RodA/SpoVE family cell cycle protein [Patescibacteria group bacterium]
MKIWFPVGVLVFASLVMLSSISSSFLLLQLGWLAAGIVIVGVMFALERAGMLRAGWFSWTVYGVAVALLLITLFVAPGIRNTRSWLVFGPFHFQPVELAKLALILVFAQYFSRRHLSIARLRYVFISGGICAVPVLLTLLQPDLGSAIILVGLWFGFLLVSGLPRKWIIASLVLFVIALAIGWSVFLKDYQRDRIAAVFYPERNALGINYSVIQSKIAIGSAGFWGKGYGQGSQTQLGFLTDPATDFIFSALVEEWGRIAGLIIIAALVFLCIGILREGLRAETNFEKFVSLGMVVVFGLHFLVNTGSAVGLLPVIGVPFPFLSYGGSNMLLNFSLVGAFYAIRRRS